MSDQFPLYPYASDPLRVLSPDRPPRVHLSPPAEELPPAGDDPAPRNYSQDEGRNQPQGGRAGSSTEAPADSAAATPPTDPSPDTAHDPAPPDPAAERNEIMRDWLLEHWDTVEALARAGEAPLRPAPPPPEPDEAEPADSPPVYVARGDRWTKWKMAEFLRQLAATHSVTAAARSVGMSRNSAYKLRSRLKGQPFDIAWEAAFRHGYDDLAHAALELALEGEDVPHYYQGELKATHRKRNPQLMVQLLKMRNRVGAPMLGRYGAAAEFWSENWERMVHRIETGSVTWDDEHKALSEEERAGLDMSNEKKKLDLLIERNRPDEPRGRFGR